MDCFSDCLIDWLLQGAGTAIGELPPYFMARAARLSGQSVDDEDYEEIEELMQEKKVHPNELVSLVPFAFPWRLRLIDLWWIVNRL